MSSVEVFINTKRKIGVRDPKIYGHFLEHFHRQIYDGILDPKSTFSDHNGIRKDVVEALKKINPPIVRWPGGCFVSAYHWKDGVGENRLPSFDKAWRVEEPNTFGTDEFIDFCRMIGAEPYICTNAGTGTSEEMSDWVEYCNLKNEGKWAKMRIDNGNLGPFNVRYWSIGNENYFPGEMGSKTAEEWGRFVKESAKMMKRVDPTIELLAASVPDIDWNVNLLREAGQYLDWISIHDYWDHLWQDNNVSDYESCMAKSMLIENAIIKTEHMLGSMGYLGKIRIAFDEWNLRSWHHPNVDKGLSPEDYITPRDKNDLNSTYTTADAVFSACFFNQCLKHCNSVGMANFAPTVNTRGIIYSHDKGIVLRSTYYVFQLYSEFMGDCVVDSWVSQNEEFEVALNDKIIKVPELDIAATIDSKSGTLRVAVINRHPEKSINLCLKSDDYSKYSSASIKRVSGNSKDSYNDIDRPFDVVIDEENISGLCGASASFEVKPHSVNVIAFK